jgi:hypothetical protein
MIFEIKSQINPSFEFKIEKSNQNTIQIWIETFENILLRLLKISH